MVLYCFSFPFEVAVRSGIEHCPRVLLANLGTKVQTKNKTAKDFAVLLLFKFYFSVFPDSSSCPRAGPARFCVGNASVKVRDPTPAPPLDWRGLGSRHTIPSTWGYRKRYGQTMREVRPKYGFGRTFLGERTGQEFIQ